MKTKVIIIVTLVAILIPTIVLAVNFSNPGCTEPGNCFLLDLRNFRGRNNTFADLFRYIIELTLAVVGIISIAFIVYGGFQYITSRGDDEQATAGKKTLTNAIIGLAIVILSYIIVTVIINALRGNP